MPPATWKGVERRVCGYLGANRTPLSGSNSRHGTSSDCLHERLYIEIKHGLAVPRTWDGMLRLFIDTEQKAALENKRPVVVMHPKRVKDVGSYLSIIKERLSDGTEHLVVVPLKVVKELTAEKIVNETAEKVTPCS